MLTTALAQVDAEPVNAVLVTPAGLVTLSFAGCVRYWTRPPVGPGTDDARAACTRAA